LNDSTPDHDGVRFRTPTVADGAAVWRLVTESGVLDPNSSYLYLLLCKDFAETCVIAEVAGRVVGFVTGYRPPSRPGSVFLWQVGVDASMRGHGLGKRLVSAFLQSPGAAGADTLETTISPSNTASRGLFGAIARDIGAEMQVGPGFTQADFPPEGDHEDEELYRIGPLQADRIKQLTL